MVYPWLDTSRAYRAAISGVLLSNSNRLDDKKSLKVQLHRITEIPVLALRGRPLSDFSFDERVNQSKEIHNDVKEHKLPGSAEIHQSRIDPGLMPRL
jgi:hypothetical protein